MYLLTVIFAGTWNSQGKNDPSRLPIVDCNRMLKNLCDFSVTVIVRMFYHPAQTSCSFRQTLLNFSPRRILSMAKKNSFQAIATETKKKRKYTKWLVTAAVAKKRSSVPILIPLWMRRALNKNKPPISTSRCCCCRRDMCYARPLKTLRYYLSNGNHPLPFSTKPGQTDVGTPSSSRQWRRRWWV